MIDRNIKNTIMTRIQLYGDDNICTNTQYQSPLSGSTVNNSVKMRFNLQGNLGNLTSFGLHGVQGTEWWPLNPCLPTWLQNLIRTGAQGSRPQSEG